MNQAWAWPLAIIASCIVFAAVNWIQHETKLARYEAQKEMQASCLLQGGDWKMGWFGHAKCKQHR